MLVVGGFDQDWNGFLDHPQLVFWTGESKDLHRHLRAHQNSLPDNVHGVLVSRFISHDILKPIREDCKKKRATVMTTANQADAKRMLTEIITPPAKEPESVKEQPVVEAKKPEKGQLKNFVARSYNPNVTSNSAEARRLLPLAKAAGIDTTEGSIGQAIGALKREAGLTMGVKKTRQKREKGEKKQVPMIAAAGHLADILKLMDEAMAGMQLAREQITQYGAKTDELVKIKAALAELSK